MDPYFVSEASLEVACESRRLDPLQFSVLHRLSTQVVIQLHSKDGCSGALILAALLSFKEQSQAQMRDTVALWVYPFLLHFYENLVASGPFTAGTCTLIILFVQYLEQ